MNKLPILLLLLFGLSACGSTQTNPQSSNSNTASSQSNIKDLIIGKWRLSEQRARRTKDGPIEVINTLPDSLNFYIEYLTDNTVLHTQKADSLDDVEKPSEAIRNATWKALNDETIEKIYDSCHTRTESGEEKCEKETGVSKIIFQDSDTLLDFGKTDRTDVGAYSEYAEKFYVYERINP